MVSTKLKSLTEKIGEKNKRCVIGVILKQKFVIFLGRLEDAVFPNIKLDDAV